MTPVQILFLIVGVLSVSAAILTVSTRNIVHASLWLVVTLFFIAVVFVLLEASFFAAVQVLLYIGAISILLIFAIMLTRRVMYDSGPQTLASWPAAVVVSLASLVGLIALILYQGDFDKTMPAANMTESIEALGLQLVSLNGYVLPFELISVTLVLALIGAIAVALPINKSEKE